MTSLSTTARVDGRVHGCPNDTREYGSC